jgi:hypothetical protein
VLQAAAAKWWIVASHAGAEVVGAEPFVEIELDLSTLWIRS